MKRTKTKAQNDATEADPKKKTGRKKKPGTMKIELTFLQELLGTATANPDLYEEFIASKAPVPAEAEDEVKTLPKDIEAAMAKSTTVFHRDAKKCPCIYDFQVKGFMKDACSMLARCDGTRSSKIKAFRKEIDGLIFVTPRLLRLKLPPGTEPGICQRPLRASTAQGERVALARSETVPIGTTVRISLNILSDRLHAAIAEWLDYGRLRGLGQWRNSGKGRFSWKQL